MNLDILQHDKAKFVVMDGKYKESEIPLQFNPPTYSVEQSNEYSEKKLMGLKGTINQFTGTKKADLTLELLFDSTSTGGDVRDLIEPLYKIVDIDNTLHAPPPCRFVWSKLSFDGIVATFKKEFTYFFTNGTPARAKISLTLKPYVKVKETAKSIDLQSSDISKKRVLIEGDTIFAMAYREYKTAAMWREIAEKNSIDNPLEIAYGTELLLPSKDSDE
jgi:hypothetical protein